MKSIIYSVVAIFTLACLALAQQTPDSVASNSEPSSLQLRAQQGPHNTVILTWRGDPTSPGFNIYESPEPHGTYILIAIVGPNVQRYALPAGVQYYFKVCDRLAPQTCSNEAHVRFPPSS